MFCLQSIIRILVNEYKVVKYMIGILFLFISTCLDENVSPYDFVGNTGDVGSDIICYWCSLKGGHIDPLTRRLGRPKLIYFS